VGEKAYGVGAAAWVLSACLCLAGAGCNPAGRPVKAPARSAAQPRDTRIVHEDCPLDDSNAQREDVNGDGRPDRTTVQLGGGRACRAFDFNFDGVIDAWEYLDASGAVARRENDYDRDGRIDDVALYKQGVLTERDRATSLGGKLDTWQYYVGGKVARAERDSNGDDYVDQWWEYPDGRSEDCPLIHSDVDGDGHPDPGATVDVCQNQPQAAKDDATGEANRATPDVPTEVPSAPEETNGPAPGPGAGSGTAPSPAQGTPQ